MKPFQFVEAEFVAQAAGLLEVDPGRNRVIAGGTDILAEIKEGVESPAALVSLANLEDLREVTPTSDGLRVGALTTLTELEGHPHVTQVYPALAQAVASVGTPQVRNVGTLGGNLCQRPRCWYYRGSLFDCRKKGGTICFAIEGSNKYHAILDGRDCYIVHPSDAAVALISYRAEAIVAGSGGSRTMPLDQFFVWPDSNIMAENVLQPGELLTHVNISQTSPRHRSLFLKARERQTQDFALASVALVLELDGGHIRDARLTLGGVAPVPYCVPHAEEALHGASVDGIDPKAIGELAVQGARPLRGNQYKVALTASLVARAVRTLLEETAR